MFRGKRGYSILFTLIELMLAFTASGIFINFAADAASSEDIQRFFLAKDSALVMDTLQALPGNARIDYRTVSFNGSYDMNVNPDSIAITHPLLPTIKKIFIADRRFAVGKTKLAIQPGQGNTIQFAKSGNDISVGNAVDINIRKQTCQLANITRNDLAKVFIDVDVESKAIYNFFSAKQQYASVSEGSDEERIVQMNAVNPTVIIVIRKANDNLRIGVPVNSKVPGKDLRFACLLFNELVSAEPNIDLATVPSDNQIVNSFKDKPAIVITGDVDSLLLSRSLEQAILKYPED